MGAQGVTIAMKLIADTLRGAASLLYPPQCAVCRRPLVVPRDPPMCGACFRNMPTVGRDVCLKCGAPQGPHVGVVPKCVMCRGVTPGLARTVAVGSFDGSLAESLRLMKFARRLDLAPMLGALLAGQVRGAEFRDRLDAIVPVPLHWRRAMRRGFDQSVEIANAIGAQLGVPVHRALVRTKDTPPQTRLTRAKRLANVAGAFAVRRRFRSRLAGKTVLLVDDVMTTGATLQTCATTLKRRGIATVYGAVVARTKL